MSNKPHNIPATATAELGEVMLDGPDGLAMSFTPEAASKSAAAMAQAANKAHRQNQATRRPK
jgi:hypothetical protein